MIFIDPKTDFAFKKIFDSESNKPIAIAFLNALLYEGQSVIENIDILNPPYWAPKIRGFKNTYLDVSAKIAGDKTIVIKVQVLKGNSFDKQILYKAAKEHSFPLRSGLDYTLDNPAIALTITDFTLFPNQQQEISHFLLTDTDYLSDYLIYNIELVFVELPKFTKGLDELETVTDKWIYFLKNTQKLRTIPDIMGSIPEIKQALELCDRANLSLEELEDLEQREIFIHDLQGAVFLAVQQGIQQGIQQGMRDAKVEVAKRLLDILDEQTISQTTGLTIEDIQNLRREEGK